MDGKIWPISSHSGFGAKMASELDPPTPRLGIQRWSSGKSTDWPLLFRHDLAEIAGRPSPINGALSPALIAAMDASILANF